MKERNNVKEWIQSLENSIKLEGDDSKKFQA